jgi:hypothetical protein
MHRWLLCWMFLVPLAAALVQGQTGTPTAGVVEGTVTNGATDAPISGARVTLDSIPSEGEPRFTRTDSEGRFQFAGVSPGVYGVGAEQPGLAQCGSAVSCSVGVTLKADSPHATIAISLKPYAVLAGRVTDFNGLPVPGSAIEVFTEVKRSPAGVHYSAVHVLADGRQIARAHQGRTDDRGEFRIPRIDAGTYYVAATKSGQGAWDDSSNRVTYYPGVLDLASARPVEIAAGRQVRADIQIVRQPGVRVAGRFRNLATPADSSGRFAYTNVTLVPEQNSLLNTNGPFATTGTEQFELEGIRPGKYTLLALTRESHGGPWDGDQTPILAANVRIDVPDGGAEGLAVELQPLPDVRGVVSFAQGCAAVPVRVRGECHNTIGACRAETVSGSDGAFVLKGSAPGQMALTARGEAISDRRLALLSAKLGDRDVLDSGFEYPFAGDAILRIVMGCPANGSWK